MGRKLTTMDRRRYKARKVIEEFEQYHNHSWYDEIWLRNKATLDDPALFYRHNTISYRAMFEKINMLAGALQSIGIKKGIEIPVCMSNSPELIYIMGAASMLGAIINVFSASYPLDYIEEIINGCNSTVGFFEDNNFAIIHSAVRKTNLKKYILCSLSDSLPSEAKVTEIEGNGFVVFSSSVDKWLADYSEAIWFYDFIKMSDRKLDLSERVTLDDVFTVTYTSGSTNALCPKAIVQRVRSFCVIGRFHDPDLMHGMHFKAFRGLAIIPPNSNTDLISCISDTLMQGAMLTIEPVYEANFFLDSLLLNKPCFVTATRSFWVTAVKQLFTEEKYKHTKLPFLLMAFAVGEELSINEEQFLNKALRKADAGRDFHHLPISPICICVAGGDCEHGSILYQLFRAVTNFSFNQSSEKRYGMTAFDFVDIAVLDSDGKIVGPNKIGRLVANSPCTMKCYKNNPSATEAFFVKDSNGKTWGDMSVFGYIDKKGRVYMRNRILNKGIVFPPFEIADEILKDKVFLSCEVVKYKDGYIAHIEVQPDYKGNIHKTMICAKERCQKKFGKDLSDSLLFRIHSGTNSFKLTGSGKRDIRALINEGISKAVRV